MIRWSSLRPLNGWRAFAGEVGVIVLGVLIALVVQQWAERGDVAQETADARIALRADYVELVVNARERIAEDRCIRRRLEQLATLLDTGAGRLPPLGDIGSPPGRTWYPPSWNSVVGTRVAARMPRADLLAFGTIALAARSTEEQIDDELLDWAQLYAVVGPGRELSPAEAANLRAALARASYRLNLVRLVAPQLIQMIDDTHLLGPADLATAREMTAKVLAGPNARAICGPIRPPGQRRLTAPYDPAVQADPLYGDPPEAPPGR